MMKKLSDLSNRICEIFTPKRVAVVLGIFFALTMIPILYVAPAVRATGDDLGYSAGVHQALANGEGLTGAAAAIADKVVSVWYSWQGTWSSIVLFCLQPGLLGDAWYPLTVVVSLACILGGTWYFLQVMLKRLGFETSFRWIVFFLAAIMAIQYMPYPRGGIYWWTSIAHYCIPYCAALLSMGWSLRWLDTGKKRYFVGIALLMTYLGGAGYPALVLAAVWMFLMILGGVTGGISAKPVSSGHTPVYNDGHNTTGPAVPSRTPRTNATDASKGSPFAGSEGFPPKDGTGTKAEDDAAAVRRPLLRALLLVIPLLLEMIGFAVSAAAPGNTVRGGEGFGFSVSNVVYTLTACVKDGLTEGIGYFLTARPLIFVLIVIAAFAWEMAPQMAVRSGKGKVRAWQPVLVILIGFGITCIIRAPEIYAGTEVSGGVPDTYWFVTMTALAICVSYLAAWLRNLRDGKVKRNLPESMQQTRLAPVVLLVCALLCLMLSRYMVGATVDYTCVNFVSSGAFSDYKEQMTEWLEILNDPDITDAELPAMNDEQGPFMLMVPTEDPTDYTSTVYRNYYGKNSVIMVERK